jgi:hypothetical protein
MGILNRALGMNLTNEMPLIENPFNVSEALSYVVPPAPSKYMITEDGKFMLTENGINLMITEA